MAVVSRMTGQRPLGRVLRVCRGSLGRGQDVGAVRHVVQSESSCGVFGGSKTLRMQNEASVSAEIDYECEMIRKGATDCNTCGRIAKPWQLKKVSMQRDDLVESHGAEGAEGPIAVPRVSRF